MTFIHRPASASRFHKVLYGRIRGILYGQTLDVLGHGMFPQGDLHGEALALHALEVPLEDAQPVLLRLFRKAIQYHGMFRSPMSAGGGTMRTARTKPARAMSRRGCRPTRICESAP